MVQQAVKEEAGNILKCARHEIALMHGPLRKRAPENLLKAFRMYSELPLGLSDYFWTPNTKKHKHSSFPTFFSVRPSLLETEVPFLLRFLFANCSLVASGESADSVARSTAVDDLAKMDAHSAAVARSVPYDASDMIDGGVMMKSVRAFLGVMKRLPVDFPKERVGKDEFDHLANMGKRGVKRPVEEKTDIEDHAAVAERRMPATQRRCLLRDLILDAADRILATVERRPGVAKLRNVVELGHQDVIVSFWAVRYANLSVVSVCPCLFCFLMSPRLPLLSL